MSKTVSKTLRLPADVDAALKAAARREGRSENAVAVAAIERYTAERAALRDAILDRAVARDAGLLTRLAR